MIIAQEIMLNIGNMWGYIVSFLGILIAAATFIYTMSQNSKKELAKKADMSFVLTLENDMKYCEKTKSSIDYVDKEIKQLHHRIKNVEDHNKEKLDLIINMMNTMNININKLL